MKLAILGTVGVPGRYGGFETLAENLVRQHQTCGWQAQLTVYCSAPAYPERTPTFLDATLRYSRLKANGLQSIFYDAVTLLDSARQGHDVALLLGVSGAWILPFLRIFSRMRIVTNVDGIEWRRGKWKRPARLFLRFSEWLAVRFSHQVIADNDGIADYLREFYGIDATVIAYGGDHAMACVDPLPDEARMPNLPKDYALALCRIEPENNVAMILEGFAAAGRPLVFVGNWEQSEYGLRLKALYRETGGIHLLDPIYEQAILYQLRAGASVYVHGHSAGGTNPALVEMMHFGAPVIAFDCVYNRNTTENQAIYFDTAVTLTRIVSDRLPRELGNSLHDIAVRRYSWSQIGREYLSVFSGEFAKPP